MLTTDWICDRPGSFAWYKIMLLAWLQTTAHTSPHILLSASVSYSRILLLFLPPEFCMLFLFSVTFFYTLFPCTKLTLLASIIYHFFLTYSHSFLYFFLCDTINFTSLISALFGLQPPGIASPVSEGPDTIMTKLLSWG